MSNTNASLSGMDAENYNPMPGHWEQKITTRDQIHATKAYKFASQIWDIKSRNRRLAYRQVTGKRNNLSSLWHEDKLSNPAEYEATDGHLSRKTFDQQKLSWYWDYVQRNEYLLDEDTVSSPRESPQVQRATPEKKSAYLKPTYAKPINGKPARLTDNSTDPIVLKYKAMKARKDAGIEFVDSSDESENEQPSRHHATRRAPLGRSSASRLNLKETSIIPKSSSELAELARPQPGPSRDFPNEITKITESTSDISKFNPNWPSRLDIEKSTISPRVRPDILGPQPSASHRAPASTRHNSAAESIASTDATKEEAHEASKRRFEIWRQIKARQKADQEISISQIRQSSKLPVPRNNPTPVAPIVQQPRETSKHSGRLADIDAFMRKSVANSFKPRSADSTSTSSDWNESSVIEGSRLAIDPPRHEVPKRELPQRDLQRRQPSIREASNREPLKREIPKPEPPMRGPSARYLPVPVPERTFKTPDIVKDISSLKSTPVEHTNGSDPFISPRRDQSLGSPRITNSGRPYHLRARSLDSLIDHIDKQIDADPDTPTHKAPRRNTVATAIPTTEPNVPKVEFQQGSEPPRPEPSTTQARPREEAPAVQMRRIVRLSANPVPYPPKPPKPCPEPDYDAAVFGYYSPKQLPKMISERQHFAIINVAAEEIERVQRICRRCNESIPTTPEAMLKSPSICDHEVCTTNDSKATSNQAHRSERNNITEPSTRASSYNGDPTPASRSHITQLASLREYEAPSIVKSKYTSEHPHYSDRSRSNITKPGRNQGVVPSSAKSNLSTSKDKDLASTITSGITQPITKYGYMAPAAHLSPSTSESVYPVSTYSSYIKTPASTGGPVASASKSARSTLNNNRVTSTQNNIIPKTVAQGTTNDRYLGIVPSIYEFSSPHADESILNSGPKWEHPTPENNSKPVSYQGYVAPTTESAQPTPENKHSASNVAPVTELIVSQSPFKREHVSPARPKRVHRKSSAESLVPFPEYDETKAVPTGIAADSESEDSRRSSTDSDMVVADAKKDWAKIIDPRIRSVVNASTSQEDTLHDWYSKTMVADRAPSPSPSSGFTINISIQLSRINILQLSTFLMIVYVFLEIYMASAYGKPLYCDQPHWAPNSPLFPWVLPTKLLQWCGLAGAGGGGLLTGAWRWYEIVVRDFVPEIVRVLDIIIFSIIITGIFYGWYRSLGPRANGRGSWWDWVGSIV